LVLFLGGRAKLNLLQKNKKNVDFEAFALLGNQKFEQEQIFFRPWRGSGGNFSFNLLFFGGSTNRSAFRGFEKTYRQGAEAQGGIGWTDSEVIRMGQSTQPLPPSLRVGRGSGGGSGMDGFC